MDTRPNYSAALENGKFRIYRKQDKAGEYTGKGNRNRVLIGKILLEKIRKKRKSPLADLQDENRLFRRN